MSIFNHTSKITIPQSVHDLSHTVSGSFYPGLIYPIFCDKVVPGDKFRITSVPFIRSQPFVAPLFTNVRVSFRYFYCRNLLLWPNFDEFITGKVRNGSGNVSNHVHPYINYDFDRSSYDGDQVAFFDWIYRANGLVQTSAQETTITFDNLDALPARMYNRIFTEYYANENLMSTVNMREADGQDNQSSYKLRKACYKKDYFTSGLPWPQRGTSVALPTDVILKNPASLGLTASTKVKATGVNPAVSRGYMMIDEVSSNLGSLKDSSDHPLLIDPDGTLTTQIDVREFRQASAVQRFLERSAINGNRYAEYILSNYGVYIPDRSAYRPQYLGGGEQLINFSPVEQTSPGGVTPQGNLAGKGTLAGVVGMNKTYMFAEHGWIMCCMVIRPDASYIGGIPRHFRTTNDRLEDYYNPLFQNIGMQEVKRSEISFVHDGHNDDTFCYQERYADYKTITDSVHGNLLTDMKPWIAARWFDHGNTPSFNEAFVQVDKNAFANNVAVDDYPPFFGSIRHNIVAHRPMQYKAKYGGAV